MGHWGKQSHDNDACQDILDKPYNIDEGYSKDNPDATTLEHLLTNYCIPSAVDPCDTPQELYLGIVIWGLQRGAIVSRKRLQHALRCALQLVDDNEYLHNWKDSAMRRQFLQREAKQIRKWLSLSPKEFSTQKALGTI